MIWFGDIQRKGLNELNEIAHSPEFADLPEHFQNAITAAIQQLSRRPNGSLSTRIHYCRMQCVRCKQTDFAEKLGVSKWKPASWEQGRSKPTDEEISRMAFLARVPENWLRFGEQTETKETGESTDECLKQIEFARQGIQRNRDFISMAARELRGPEDFARAITFIDAALQEIEVSVVAATARLRAKR